jgi:hypothetical protein
MKPEGGDRIPERVMLPPILMARGVYENGERFDVHLDAHLRHGYVISTPTVFAMGRPVSIDAPERESAEISHRFRKPDCWLIWSAAGELRALIAVLPFPLPWIAFHRGGGRRVGPQRLKRYRFERLAGLVRSAARLATEITEEHREET